MTAIRPGPTNSLTDVRGLLVGQAQDDVIKTGVTVVASSDPFKASVHVMGGAPGTRETDLLAPDKPVEHIDAIVLSGGSAYGLDAASGVHQALRDDGRGLAVGPATIPIVPAAILFDLINGGNKQWSSNPYSHLGARAYRNLATEFDQGSYGAGAGATTAGLKGGLGSASLVLANGVTVAALVAANPLGQVISNDKGQFWAAPFEQGDEYGGLGSGGSPIALPQSFMTKMDLLFGGDAKAANHGNTSLAIVATDAPLTKAQLARLAIAAHDGFARSIVPSHTQFDGDIVFSISSGDNRSDLAVQDVWQIGHAAAICVSRAVARGVYLATHRNDDVFPTWRQRFAAP